MNTRNIDIRFEFNTIIERFDNIEKLSRKLFNGKQKEEEEQISKGSNANDEEHVRGFIRSLLYSVCLSFVVSISSRFCLISPEFLVSLFCRVDLFEMLFHLSCVLCLCRSRFSLSSSVFCPSLLRCVDLFEVWLISVSFLSCRSFIRSLLCSMRLSCVVSISSRFYSISSVFCASLPCRVDPFCVSLISIALFVDTRFCLIRSMFCAALLCRVDLLYVSLISISISFLSCQSLRGLISSASLLVMSIFSTIRRPLLSSVFSPSACR